MKSCREESPLKQKAIEFIHAHQNFCLICHDNPDGDTLGSALGLFFSLQKMGKRATIVCGDPVPKKYIFLPGIQHILSKENLLPKEYATICIDCSAKSMLEKSSHQLQSPSLCIDHHTSNLGNFTDLLFCDPLAASTGEIIQDLILSMGVPLDADIATCFLCAISSDTGHFGFANTQPDTMQHAAVLIESGADIQSIFQHLYRNRSLPATKLIGTMIQNTVMIADGRGACATISALELHEAGATSAEMEGIIDFIRDIDSVKVCALIRELPDGTCKASLRSKTGDIDVCRLVRTLGGGGHPGAAGVSLPYDLAKSRDIIQELIASAV